MYDIYIEKAAERDLKKLPAADFERIIPHLKSLVEDAKPPGSRKNIGHGARLAHPGRNLPDYLRAQRERKSSQYPTCQTQA